jgi:hypothetical protein
MSTYGILFLKYPLNVLLIKINPARIVFHVHKCKSFVRRSLWALSQCLFWSSLSEALNLSSVCSSSNLVQLIRPFLLSTFCVLRWSLESNLFFSAFFWSLSFDWCIVLSCLFVCFVCSCSMIDASRVNAIREALESLKLKNSEQQHYSGYRQVCGSCPNNYLITHCIAMH